MQGEAEAAMDNDAFDRALVGAAFELAAEEGWGHVGVAAAARRAGLPLDRARQRFPVKLAILARFGVIADQTALASASSEGSHRDRLFDLLMRRFDALQAHRAGVVALMRALPLEPLTAAFLAAANFRSMGWLLEGAGISASGPLGSLRTKALMVVHLAALRAWMDDASEDQSATMAALDRALDRAEQVQAHLPGWLRRDGGEPAEPAAEEPLAHADGGEGASEAEPPVDPAI
jgi:ubiquinone biosynthesis protein COQ9